MPHRGCLCTKQRPGLGVAMAHGAHCEALGLLQARMSLARKTVEEMWEAENCSSVTWLWLCGAEFQPDSGEHGSRVNTARTLDTTQARGPQTLHERKQQKAVRFKPQAKLRVQVGWEEAMGLPEGL